MGEQKTPRFLTEDSATKDSMGEGELSNLAGLVDAFVETATAIEILEEQLAAKKKALTLLGGERIPQLLRQYGLSEIRLADKRKIVVREDATVTVPQAKQAAFYAFLEKRGEEDIVKLHATFERMEQEKLDEVLELLKDYPCDVERSVHPQTLKKYFRDLLGLAEDETYRAAGVAAGTFLRKEDAEVQAIANVFTYFTTKIR